MDLKREMSQTIEESDDDYSWVLGDPDALTDEESTIFLDNNPNIKVYADIPMADENSKWLDPNPIPTDECKVLGSYVDDYGKVYGYLVEGG